MDLDHQVCVLSPPSIPFSFVVNDYLRGDALRCHSYPDSPLPFPASITVTLVMLAYHCLPISFLPACCLSTQLLPVTHPFSITDLVSKWLLSTVYGFKCHTTILCGSHCFSLAIRHFSTPTPILPISFSKSKIWTSTSIGEAPSK